MIKTIVIFCVFFTLILCETPDYITEHRKCQNIPELHLDHSVFENLHKNHSASKPTNFNKYMMCVAKGINVLDDAGNINEAGVKAQVELVEKDAQKAEEITKTCSGLQKPTVDETINQLWRCMFEKNIFRELKSDHSDESSSSESHEHKQPTI
ncbi:hypothetical protein ABEB36_003279 [Hypothenemus hampei]|uniref:Uncharacterized protein n=1 Tax=Hypothenemus hampei TaxID=57062 RepID=A0ABD1F8L9_HYPHA